MTEEELTMFYKISGCFSGFDLQRRAEWTQGPWRLRMLPNKDTRQDYRVEVYGETMGFVVRAAYEHYVATQEAHQISPETRTRSPG